METRNPNLNRNDVNRVNPAMTSGTLCRLDDMDDFKVADGDPDVRGWDVLSLDGKRIGEVDSLIVDTAAMKVRFLDVELDHRGLNLRDERHVLLPLADARLNDDDDKVRLTRLNAAAVAALPPYRHGELVDAGDRDHDKDLRGFYGKRGTGSVERMTLSEEELRLGKRATNAGEARVHKTVETEHVTRKVPVAHEELVVETRPVQPGATTDKASFREDEIRIPLMAEEPVVEKRAVAKEEVVIRKEVVRDDRTVEADLRRERVDVDRDGKTRGTRH